MGSRRFSSLSSSDDVNPATVETLKTLGCSVSQICLMFTFPHSFRCLALPMYICVHYPCMGDAVRLLISETPSEFPP